MYNTHYAPENTVHDWPEKAEGAKGGVTCQNQIVK